MPDVEKFMKIHFLQWLEVLARVGCHGFYFYVEIFRGECQGEYAYKIW